MQFSDNAKCFTTAWQNTMHMHIDNNPGVVTPILGHGREVPW